MLHSLNLLPMRFHYRYNYVIYRYFIRLKTESLTPSRTKVADVNILTPKARNMMQICQNKHTTEQVLILVGEL